ncbi:uncharacterized protein LOC131954257 [Physella acuta]|uniref:uncharacterized protein LOC131954257 n=1 Tax=Physella acuta TaxID=109671 RepID=UPI0027DE024C|nr:uncharacterized protein LOC131954257 [Physella acuta]
MLQCVLVLGLYSLVSHGLEIEKPPVPKFTSVICTDTYEITVSFDRGTPRPDWIDDYQITLTVGDESFILCTMTINRTDPRWHDSVLTCTQKMEINVVSTKNVTLSILVARPSLNITVHNVTISENYFLIDHIVPSTVQELNATSIGATSATISWRLSQYLADLMFYMEKSPLQYRIIVNKTDGLPELWNVTLKKINLKTDSRYVHVELVNLTSYTGYTVTVYGIAGGGEGERQKIRFTTGMSVPTTPPTIENFSYSWIYSPDNKVLVMWNPLSRDAIGGSNFTYQLEVTVGQANPTTQFVKKPHFVHKLSSLSETITIKVWSVNKVGRSVNYSTLVIPKAKHFHQDGATVTLVDRDHVTVNISLADVADKQMVAVHWCETEKDQIFGIYNVCKEKLMTHTEKFNNSRITNRGVYRVPVNVRMFRQEQLGSLMHRQITYYESTSSTYEGLSGSLTNATIDQAGSVAHTDGAGTEGHPDVDKLKFFHSVMEGGHWIGIVPVSENSVLNNIKETKEIQTNVIVVVVACVSIVCIIGLIIVMYFGVKQCIKRRRYFNTHVVPPVLADQMEPMIQQTTLGYNDDRTGSSNETESGLGASVADTEAPSQGSATDTSARSSSNHVASTNGQENSTNGQHNSTNSQQNSTNSQQNSTNGQQNSTNGQENSTNSQQNSTNSQQNSTNSQQNSTNGQQNSTNGQEQNSTNGQENSTNSQQNSTNSQQNSTNSQQNSTNGQQNSTNGQENSTNSQQNSTNSQQDSSNGQQYSTSSGSRSGTRTSGHYDASTSWEAGPSTGSRVGDTSSSSDLEQRKLLEELGLEMCFDSIEDEG